MATQCLVLKNRQYQLIKKSPVTGEERAVIDILGAPKIDLSDVPPNMQVPTLLNKANRGISLLEGLDGLYHLPREVPIDKGAYTEGARVSKWPRTEPREGQLTFATKGRDIAEWQQYENILWWLLNVDGPCYLRVFDHDGSYRELKLQLRQSPADKYKNDIGMRAYAIHLIDYIAADPFWYSDELTVTIRRSEMTLNTTTGWYEGAVPVENPTDWRCFLEWAQAPMTAGAPEQWAITDAVKKPEDPDDLSDLVLGQPIVIPELSAGSEFLIRTHPSPEGLWIETLDDRQVPSEIPGIQPENALPAHLVDPLMLPVKLKGGTPDSAVTCFMPQRWQRYVGGQKVVF